MFGREVIRFFEVIRDVEETAVAVEFVGLVSDVLRAGKSSPVGLIVTKNPVARMAFLALKLRKETAAIDGIIFSKRHPGSLGEGGVEVGEIDEVIGDQPCGTLAFPGSDEGDVSSHVGGAALPSFDLLAIPSGGQGNVRSIVSGEEDEGVLELAHLVDFLDDLANDLVEIFHHGDEVGLASRLTFGLLVRLVSAGTVADVIGRGDEGIVNEDGGIVDEEGLILVSVDEIADEVRHDVGSVFFMVVFLGEELPVLLKRRAPESLPTPFATFLGGDLPETIFIKPCVDGTRGILASFCLVVEPVELPLASDGRFVACGLQKVGKGFFLRVEVSEVSVVSEVVLPGHDLDAGGGANGGSVTVVEADPFGGERVDVGSFVIFGTIAAEAFPADIISHDEDDVGPRRGKSQIREEEKS